jgi:phosphotriesterase-related protein
MALVQTVRGPIDSSKLGTTLMHEHVFVLDTEILQNYPEEWGSEEKRIADAIMRLNELKAKGVDTIVDLTVIGLGRYLPRIKQIAQRQRSTSLWPQEFIRITMRRFTFTFAARARCWAGRS